MKNEEDHFDVLRRIQKKPESSQRELAEELGFSLGKLNYCWVRGIHFCVISTVYINLRNKYYNKTQYELSKH